MESLSLKSSKDVGSLIFSCGSGGSGVLLQKDCEDLPIAKQVYFSKNWKVISVGNVRALGITSEGEIYEWGEIDAGFASHPIPINEPRAPLFPTKVVITAVSCGCAHSLFLSDSGEVYAAGDGKQGQLGLGPSRLEFQKTPEKIPLSEKIRMIRAGFRQSYFISESEEMFFCGSNKFMEMGIKTTENILPDPTKVQLEGKNILSTGKLVKKIVSGQKHGALILGDGALFAWGDNTYGQLGLEVSKDTKKIEFTLITLELQKGDSIVDIESGWNHVLLLTAEGEVWMAGRGNFGQQALGKEDLGNKDRFHRIKFKEPIKKIFSGSEHCIVIDKSNKLWTWGWNEHGNLSLEHTETIYEPTEIKPLLDPEGYFVDDVYTGGASTFFKYVEAKKLKTEGMLLQEF